MWCMILCQKLSINPQFFKRSGQGVRTCVQTGLATDISTLLSQSTTLNGTLHVKHDKI
jgi:hypothetical protein